MPTNATCLRCLPTRTRAAKVGHEGGADAASRSPWSPALARRETDRWPGAAVAAAFADAVESGRLDLPLPGGGRTRERWAVLADLAGEDLSLARLAEGHADALAILAELGAADAAGREPLGSLGRAAAGSRADGQPGR